MGLVQCKGRIYKALGSIPSGKGEGKEKEEGRQGKEGREGGQRKQCYFKIGFLSAVVKKSPCTC